MVFLTAVEVDNDVTDLRFVPFMRWSDICEGVSMGHFNNEGYNNFFDYDPGMSLDVLVMGSSETQANHVMPASCAANVLMNLSGKKIYNIGMFKHFFPTCAVNLKAAVKKYKPAEFVVIETMSVNFSDAELAEILSRQVAKVKVVTSTEVNADFIHRIYYRYIRAGVHKILTKSYSLEFFYRRLISILRKAVASAETLVTPSDPVLLNRVLEEMAKTVKDSGAKLIIAYHPSVRLELDASLTIESDSESVKIFSDACKSNGIYFIDISERFAREYKTNYVVPNGFFNTTVGSGHMNNDGHRMLAEEIYKLMQRIEVN